MIGENYEVRYETESLQLVPKKKDELAINPHLQRIESRLNAIEQERQKNLDNISIYGLFEASKISEPSKETIDRDWLNQFINVSQDISSEQMQEVWGKILAREISNPGSFSLRSLEVLRVISKQEAETFRQMVQFTVSVSNDIFIFSDHTIYNAKGKGWSAFNYLREINLFMPDVFGITIHVRPQCNPTFRYGDLAFSISASKDSTLHINALILSSVGKELAKLIEIIPNKEYFDKAREEVAKKGFKCSILNSV